MEDLRKINSLQLYYLWRNLAIGLLVMIGVIAVTHMLPFYMAPVVSLIGCGILYTLIYSNNISDNPTCMITLLSILYCLIAYTFVSIALVILDIWKVAILPNEVVFFNEPYMPSLIMMPVSLAVMVFILTFRNSMRICVECRIKNGTTGEKGYSGYLADHETRIQISNLTILFAILSAIVWIYYLCSYVDVNQNARDWYVFVWIVLLVIILDEFYFMVRYYNLYLDLQEHDEIVTPEQLQDMAAKTYLRYYVICGENIFVDTKSVDRMNPTCEVTDTPFFTRRTVNGIQQPDVRKVIEKMTGHKGGELKFFFGRHIPGLEKHSLLRYFYFLDGDISDYSEMGVDGKWMSFDEVKHEYTHNPKVMGTRFLTDLSRLSTIILTEKIYDEDGQRKNKIKSYTQPLTLGEVRKTKLDLQDDKWIHVSLFNSDTPFFKLKKLWRSMTGKSLKNRSSW